MAAELETFLAERLDQTESLDGDVISLSAEKLARAILNDARLLAFAAAAVFFDLCVSKYSG